MTSRENIYHRIFDEAKNGLPFHFHFEDPKMQKGLEWLKAVDLIALATNEDGVKMWRCRSLGLPRGWKWIAR